MNKTKAILGLLSAIISTVSATTGIVKAEGDHFVVDGCEQYFSGTNSYYMSYSTNDRVDRTLDICDKHDIRVVRSWAFIDEEEHDGIVMQTFKDGKVTINDGPTGLEKIDYMLYSANKHNVRFVMTLTNNWTDFGGMDAYVYNLGGKYHDEFYTDENVKAAYKNYIKTLLERVNSITGVPYKEDPAIFSWQLANEPRCGGSGRLPSSGNCTSETVRNWADEISTFIKSIDPNHMVSIGDEGFGVPTPSDLSYPPYPYKGDDGDQNAYQKNLELPNIDYGTYHLYTKDWGLPGGDVKAGVDWVNSHGNVGKIVGKPIVFEEYGLREKDARAEVFGAWHDAILENNVDAAHFWMIAVEDYNDYDGYTLYDSSITTLIDPFTKKLLAKGGSCSVNPPESDTCFSYPEYPCCKNTNTIVYTDNDGNWGIENNEWCGIGNGTPSEVTCWSTILGYPCCTGCETVYSDSDGEWGVENNGWCGINEASC